MIGFFWPFEQDFAESFDLVDCPTQLTSNLYSVFVFVSWQIQKLQIWKKHNREIC